MAQLPDVFKPSETEDVGFDTIPEGWYSAQAIKTEVKKTQAGDGTYVALRFKIIEGEYSGRFVFTNLNIINKNETTMRIAKAHLKQICEAVDIESLVDTDELLGQPLQIKLGIKPASGAYPEGNKIDAYRNIDEIDEDESPF